LGSPNLRPRVALLAAVLVAAVTNTEAQAATPTELSQRAASLADAISLDWSHSLNQEGAIVDPVTGQVEGGYGRTFLAYGMLRASQRNPELNLIPIIAQALPNSDGVVQAPFNLLGLSETLLSANGALGPAATEAIQTAVLSDPPFGSPTSAAACFQRAGCYDNLKLVNGTAVMATLATLPGHSGPAGSVFAAPTTAARGALRLLSSTIPRAEIPDGRLEVGDIRLRGAVLSDPTRDPPAYLALSAMMLGRALELAPPTPLALLAFQQAIVALLGLTAPNGDISYMGRGQGQVWTMASAAAGCALAMRLLASQPAITSRCESVIETELDALAIRRSLGGVGIATVPRLSWTRGVDPYVNRTDYNGLCVYALDLTADALQGLPNPGEQPLPATVSGERFTDSDGSGLATTSLHGLWFAIHRQNTNASDSRWGFGLMALQHWRAGSWISSLADRPLGPSVQGPVLISHGHDYEPIGQTIQVTPGRVVIHGGWGSARHLIRHATFVYQATASGVLLSIPIQPGDALLIREWTLPGQPGTISITVPADHQNIRRSSIPMGNDRSDGLDQVSHTVSGVGTTLVRVLWRA
jgi:hypothetical protein